MLIIRMAACIAAVLVTGFGCSRAASDSPKIELDATQTREPISKYVYGQFIEHLGRCIYGGIWAEMLEDRKFYYPIDGKGPGWEQHAGKKVSWEGDGEPYEILKASPWQIIGPASAISMSKDAPYAGEHSPVITLDGSAEPRGIYHPRLGLQAGRDYTGSIVVSASGTLRQLEVALQWGDGPDAEAVAPISVRGQDFTPSVFKFTAKADTHDGRLVIRAAGTGTVKIGAVSLMPADNVEGFRKDTLALLRELDSPIYRWPGGNFVSGYNWRDGIGERDRRPPRKNPAWTGIEHNDVGIHEFMHLCELLNTEAYIALNTGAGGIEEAAAEVAYITGAPETEGGKARAVNGRLEPWKVAWWAVGNEMYGDWQIGHMPLEEYVKKHNAVVDAVRAADPASKCVGVGAVGKWSETMLSQCADHMELISEHTYWQRKENVTEHVSAAVEQIEKIAKEHRGYREKINGLDKKNIRIALDEWNYWYGPYLYGELGTRYFMRDALGAAAALQAMTQHSDLYFMANYAQTVNVIGAIKTTPTDAFLETTGLVLKLYRNHFGSIPVAAMSHANGVHAAAAWKADKSALTLALVNANDAPRTLALETKGVTPPASLKGWTIQHSNPDAFNDERAHNTVELTEAQLGLENGALTIAPFSITLVEIPGR